MSQTVHNFVFNEVGLDAVQKELEKVKRQLKVLNGVRLGQLTQEQHKLRTSLQNQYAALKQLVNGYAQGSKGIHKAGGAMKQLRQYSDEAEKVIRKLGLTTQQSSQKVDKSASKASQSVKDTVKQYRLLASTADKAASAQQKHANAVQQYFDKTASGAKTSAKIFADSEAKKRQEIAKTQAASEAAEAKRVKDAEKSARRIYQVNKAAWDNQVKNLKFDHQRRLQAHVGRGYNKSPKAAEKAALKSAEYAAAQKELRRNPDMKPVFEDMYGKKAVQKMIHRDFETAAQRHKKIFDDMVSGRHLDALAKASGAADKAAQRYDKMMNAAHSLGEKHDSVTRSLSRHRDAVNAVWREYHKLSNLPEGSTERKVAERAFKNKNGERAMTDTAQWERSSQIFNLNDQINSRIAEKAAKEAEKASKATFDHASNQERLNAQYAQTARMLDTISDRTHKVQKLNRELQKLRDMQADSKAAESQGDEGRKHFINRYGSAAWDDRDNLANHIKRLENEIGSRSDAPIRNVHNNSRKIHGVWRGMAAAAGQIWLSWGDIAPMIAGLVPSLVAFKSFKSANDFGWQMAQVGAAAELGKDQVRALGDEILKMGGGQYTQGPVQMAEAMRVLAQAGLDVESSMKLLPNVLNAALVAGTTDEKAALFTAGLRTAYGLENDLGAVAIAIDQTAKAANISQTSIEQMMESMKQASPSAQKFGLSIADTATTLALLAQVNITGSAAGTAFKNLMTDLGGRTQKSRKALEELGLSAYDSAGKIKPFLMIIEELQNKFKGMTDQKKQQWLRSFMDERGLRAADVLLNQTTQSIKAFHHEIVKGGENFGYTSTQAANLATTAEGSFRRMKAAWETTFTTVGTASESPYVALMDKLRSIANDPSVIHALTTWTHGFASVASSVAGLLAALSPAVPMFNGLAVGLAGAMAIAIGKMAYAKVAMKLFGNESIRAAAASSGLWAAFTTQIGLTTAATNAETAATGRLAAVRRTAAAAGSMMLNSIKASPIGWIFGAITAVQALITVFDGLNVEVDEFAASAKQLPKDLAAINVEIYKAFDAQDKFNPAGALGSGARMADRWGLGDLDIEYEKKLGRMSEESYKFFKSTQLHSEATNEAMKQNLDNILKVSREAFEDYSKDVSASSEATMMTRLDHEIMVRDRAATMIREQLNTFDESKRTQNKLSAEEVQLRINLEDAYHKQFSALMDARITKAMQAIRDLKREAAEAEGWITRTWNSITKSQGELLTDQEIESVYRTGKYTNGAAAGPTMVQEVRKSVSEMLARGNSEERALAITKQSFAGRNLADAMSSLNTVIKNKTDRDGSIKSLNTMGPGYAAYIMAAADDARLRLRANENVKRGKVDSNYAADTLRPLSHQEEKNLKDFLYTVDLYANAIKEAAKPVTQGGGSPAVAPRQVNANYVGGIKNVPSPNEKSSKNKKGGNPVVAVEKTVELKLYESHLGKFQEADRKYWDNVNEVRLKHQQKYSKRISPDVLDKKIQSIKERTELEMQKTTDEIIKEMTRIYKLIDSGTLTPEGLIQARQDLEEMEKLWRKNAVKGQTASYGTQTATQITTKTTRDANGNIKAGTGEFRETMKGYTVQSQTAINRAQYRSKAKKKTVVSEYGGTATGVFGDRDMLMTSAYGVKRGDRDHQGGDYVAKDGTKDMVAMWGGVVKEVGYSVDKLGKGYGNYIKVLADNGMEYLYAHLENLPKFTAEQRVEQGQVIARMGKSGAPGNKIGHAHVEVTSVDDKGSKVHHDPNQFFGTKIVDRQGRDLNNNVRGIYQEVLQFNKNAKIKSKSTKKDGSSTTTEVQTVVTGTQQQLVATETGETAAHKLAKSEGEQKAQLALADYYEYLNGEYLQTSRQLEIRSVGIAADERHIKGTKMGKFEHASGASKEEIAAQRAQWKAATKQLEDWKTSAEKRIVLMKYEDEVTRALIEAKLKEKELAAYHAEHPEITKEDADAQLDFLKSENAHKMNVIHEKYKHEVTPMEMGAIDSIKLGAMQGYHKMLAETQSMSEIMANGVQKMWGAIGDSIVQMALTGKSNFKDMAKSIIKDMAAMIIKMLVMKALSAALGWAGGAIGGGFGSMLSGMGDSFSNMVGGGKKNEQEAKGGVYASAGRLPFARGGVFSSRGLSTFARGGVVSSPTYFGFNGGRGLMGEQGAEAVVPLTRTATGDLGVTMTGMGGGGTVVNAPVTVSVVVNSDGSTDSDVNDGKMKELGEAVRSVVLREINESLRPGGTINQSIKAGGY